MVLNLILDLYFRHRTFLFVSQNICITALKKMITEVAIFGNYPGISKLSCIYLFHLFSCINGNDVPSANNLLL